MFVIWLLLACCAAVRDELPSWPLSQAVYALTEMYFAGLSAPTKGEVWLWWDVGQESFRVDERTGDSQLVQTTLVLYATRQVFVFSANSSLCSAFCLPPRAQTLPVLEVAGNTTSGLTWAAGPGRWLRRTSVSPGESKRGLLNATVLTVTDPGSGAPLMVAANYTQDGQVLAQHQCVFADYNSPVRIDPAIFLAPTSCRSLRPTHCYKILENSPFPVAEGEREPPPSSLCLTLVKKKKKRLLFCRGAGSLWRAARRKLRVLVRAAPSLPPSLPPPPPPWQACSRE